VDGCGAGDEPLTAVGVDARADQLGQLLGVAAQVAAAVRDQAGAVREGHTPAPIVLEADDMNNAGELTVTVRL
jgi:hypothetical protein